MKWIERHNEKIFRKQVRKRIVEKLSDFNHECTVEEIVDHFGYIIGLKIIFYYKNVELALKTHVINAYFNYDDETVDSASGKIIDDIKRYCHKITNNTNTTDLVRSDAFGVFLLCDYVLNKLGGEE